MNIVDLVIIAVIAASVLFGIYRGFVASVLNTGGCIVAFILAVWAYPLIAGPIQSNTQLQSTLLNYSNALTRMGDQVLGSTVVSQSQAGLSSLAQRVVERVNLPAPISDMLARNLTGQVYEAGSTVQDYVSRTIITACVNIFSFLLCFALIYLVLSLVLSAVRAVFKLPVLKQLDGLAGAGFGLLRAVLILFVLFTLIPVAETFVPMEAVREQINASSLAGFFSSGALVSSIFNARLF
ncbi:MAG: CvpA family protein [Clostridia bacterium]|nr:CvpA family protein [Clostridia bacterium]